MDAADEAVRIAACVRAAELARLRPHAGLDRFRTPEQQLAALVDIAADPKGCVVVAAAGAPVVAGAPATTGETLVGYVAFHPPTEIESWGADRTGELVELGAIEVTPAFRGHRIAPRLLEAGFADGRFDGTVVFATLYVWHYDLQASGMTDLAYRRMLENLYRSVAMESFATSDEEVRSSAANALMARIGPRAPERVVAEFHRLRMGTHGPSRAPW